MKYNRQCNYNEKDINQILKKCAKNNEIMSIPEIIGEGTYGKVYLVEILNGDKEIKVAVKKITVSVDDKDSRESIKNEIAYSVYMSRSNIGPKIYDAFYTEDSNSFNQYIIMEHFEYDGDKFFKNRNINIDIKKEAFRQMIDLVKEQIYDYKLYCIDIKPSNFLISKKDQLKVRMIDFGGDYCSKDAKKLVEKADINTIYFMNLVQLYVLTAFSQFYLKDSITSDLPEDLLDFFKHNKQDIREYYTIGRDHFIEEGPLDQHYFLYHYTKFTLAEDRMITVDEIMEELYERVNRDIEIHNKILKGSKGNAMGSVDYLDLDSDSSDSSDSSNSTSSSDSDSDLDSNSSDSSDSDLDYDL
jgi:predicted Ser/Thr protein kinase